MTLQDEDKSKETQTQRKRKKRHGELGEEGDKGWRVQMEKKKRKSEE